MLGSLLPVALTGLLHVVGVLAADEPPSCSLDKKCPKSAPCCSRESLAANPSAAAESPN